MNKNATILISFIILAGFLKSQEIDTFLLHYAISKYDTIIYKRIIKRLEGKNKDLRLTVEPNVGHWIQWLVYPEQELYDWFLKHNKGLKDNN